LKLHSPDRRQASTKPRASRTHIINTTALEELLALYRKLPATERAAQFQSTRNISKTYSVPKRTVQRWVNEGWVAAVRIGGRHLVHVPSFDEFLHSCTFQSMK
jgi:excisionase family DNA binding protein